MLHVGERSRGIYQWLFQQETVRAGLVYALAIAVLFGPIVFLGRSLQAPLYYPHGLVESGAYGYEEREPVNTFSVEMATPAYYEWPTNVLVGELYKQGELPLWNPYQAAGTPLAAQYSSRVFFPYQILENISPICTWDFFMLGRLWLAGFFTFLFLRLFGLSRGSAFLGGIFYMFSGTFIWFINLEQFVNVAMVTPVLLWVLEGLWHWGWKRGVAISAMAIALVLLAGQPETALYVLLLGAAYVVFRVFSATLKQKVRMLGLAALAGVLGLALAAPLLVPFLEFMPLSHSIHPVGGTMGVQDPTRLFDLPQMFIPTFNEMETWHRFFPDNGRWDYLGGYTGVLLPYLILIGIVLGFLQKGSRWRKPLLFFTLFGLLVVLKNFGHPLVSWIGLLPLFDLAWTNRWAGPAWTFPLAAAGAFSLEILHDQAQQGRIREKLNQWRKWSNRFRYSATYGFLILLALSLSLVFLLLPESMAHIDVYRQVYQSPYFTPSVLMGISVAVVVLFTAIILTKRYLYSRTGIMAIAVLALMELWFAIPRGYEPATAMLKLIPFAVGLLIVLALTYRVQLQTIIGSLGNYRYLGAIVAVLAFLIPNLIIDANSEHGFPQRYNAATLPPYVDYLKSQEGYYRTTGGDGVLFPNFASTAGILDVRYILALSIDSYQNFKNHNLHIDRVFPFSGPQLWFTGGPQREVLDPQDCVTRIHRSYWEDLEGKLPFYSLLGVKYILSPSVTATPPENLLQNGSFDRWQRGPGPFTEDEETTADGWDIALWGGSPVSVSRNATDVEWNRRYSLQIDYEHKKTSPSYVRQVFRDPSHLTGKTLAFSVRIKTSTPRAVRLGITHAIGGVGAGTSWSVSHLGDGQWQTLTVTHAIPASQVSSVSVLIQLSDSATFLVANAFLIEDTEPYEGYVSPLTESFPLVYDKEIKIYQNPDAFPRAFVAQEVEFVDSLLEAQEAIRRPEFDLRNRVVLEEPLISSYNLVPGGHSSTSIVDYEANRVVINAELEQPGILVLTDVYYPGWEASVDGMTTKIYRVDGVFRGVLLEKGSHTVVFRYFPRSFAAGLYIAGSALVVCIGLFILSWWSPRRRDETKGSGMVLGK